MVDVALTIGYIGGVFTFLGMAAQVRHCFVRGNFKELSINRVGADLTTNALNLTYGVMTNNAPVCITASSVVLASIILAVYYTIEVRKEEEDDRKESLTPV